LLAIPVITASDWPVTATISTFSSNFSRLILGL
jgi:hypothetical protein